LGILVVAFDEDSTSDGGIEAGRTALVKELQTQLNEAIRSLSLPDENAIKHALVQAALDAIKDATPLLSLGTLDPDDLVGSQVQQCSFEQLAAAAAAGGTIPVELHFRGDEAHYRVTGSIRVIGTPVN
jgi:hypothetical protein